jgi:hypothetical protein
VLLDVLGDEVSLLISDGSLLNETVGLGHSLSEHLGLLKLLLGRLGASLQLLLSRLVEVLQVLGDLLAPLAAVLVVHLAADALGKRVELEARADVVLSELLGGDGSHGNLGQVLEAR